MSTSSFRSRSRSCFFPCDHQKAGGEISSIVCGYDGNFITSGTNSLEIELCHDSKEHGVSTHLSYLTKCRVWCNG
jgi:hypothetical protein